MLMDEIAELFNQDSHRVMARRTGLSRGKVDSLQHGCSFVLDAAFLRALAALGYELRLQRVAPARGAARRPSRTGENGARRDPGQERRKDVRNSGQGAW